MIHEIHESMFELPLHEYTLTFDDGLYSQYYYFDRIKLIPTEKVFFISSNIICNTAQNLKFLCCIDAHKKALEGNKEDYMTLDQIKQLMQDPLVSIGGHSHSHLRLSNYSKLLEKIIHIKQDTKEMLEWFNNNLKFTPTKFCFPYNDDYEGIYPAVLKTFGFTEFYGRERTPVETLLHMEYPPRSRDT